MTGGNDREAIGLGEPGEREEDRKEKEGDPKPQTLARGKATSGGACDCLEDAAQSAIGGAGGGAQKRHHYRCHNDRGAGQAEDRQPVLATPIAHFLKRGVRSRFGYKGRWGWTWALGSFEPPN